MNAKSLKILRIGALVLGCLLVLGMLMSIWGIWGRFYYYRNEPLKFVDPFFLAVVLRSFFSGFSHALFAFLIASVVLMIERQAPVGHDRARRLMIVCCLSYVADALAKFYALIMAMSRFLEGWSLYLPMAISAVASILYAASIFVLYTHFTKMVAFESEVA